MTPLQMFTLRLEGKGYHVLDLRDSSDDNAFVAFCPRDMMQRGYNGLRVFSLAMLSDVDMSDLNSKLAEL